MHKIRVAAWRDDRSGPKRVVSGPIGRETNHYQAPPARHLAREMNRFLHWWEKSSAETDGIIKAGIAHPWFVAIHPFENGNGRIARTVTEMALSQDENLSNRYYSLSLQIMARRKAYYEILENTNRGHEDITGWMEWFLGCMSSAIMRSNKMLSNVMCKARF